VADELGGGEIVEAANSSCSADSRRYVARSSVQQANGGHPQAGSTRLGGGNEVTESSLHSLPQRPQHVLIDIRSFPLWASFEEPDVLYDG
jgi:hypothetical protein